MSFDTWADSVADPPRCPDCGTLLRTGSRDAVGAKVVVCPLGCEVDR